MKCRVKVKSGHYLKRLLEISLENNTSMIVHQTSRVPLTCDLIRQTFSAGQIDRQLPPNENSTNLNFTREISTWFCGFSMKFFSDLSNFGCGCQSRHNVSGHQLSHVLLTLSCLTTAITISAFFHTQRTKSKSNMEKSSK